MNSSALVLVLPMLAGICAAAVLWQFISELRRRKRRDRLQARYEAIKESRGGSVLGCGFDTLHNALGAPSSAQPLGSQLHICHWNSGSFHLALVFDKQDICVDVL